MAASIICLALEIFHTRLNGSERYRFLVWNLFLAWIPFCAALLANLASKNKVTLLVFMPMCTLIWLVFFPNAPYLLTDFQHLTVIDTNAPVWLDVIMMIWFAWTGLMLGISSLYLIQSIVTRQLNAFWGWLFAIGITTLSSLGVYLGRFMRWNSWDLLDEPKSIVKDIYEIMSDPSGNKLTYLFVILFTFLFLFIYASIHVIAFALKDDAIKKQSHP